MFDCSGRTDNVRPELFYGHWVLKQFWILRKVGAPASGDLNFSRRILDFRLKSKRRSRTRSKRSYAEGFTLRYRKSKI